LPALSAGFLRREIEAYRTNRAYALSVCLRLRAQIATARVVLMGLEAEFAAVEGSPRQPRR
jgi:hypothetical protein